MESKIPTIRDGSAVWLLTRFLVPGDIVLLMGGLQVPADIEWVEGDILQVDTSALTGNSFPHKYPSNSNGNLIPSGSTIRSGEAYGIVRYTGKNSYVGSDEFNSKKDKIEDKFKVLFLEKKIMQVMMAIMVFTLVDILVVFIVQGIVRNEFTLSSVKEGISTCLSILLAAIPVLLPVVMHFTLVAGAGKIAREDLAVVTSLPAIEDIASMTVLCSDKTGTLTTSILTVIDESVWCCSNFDKCEIALYAAFASKRDNYDYVDRAVITHFCKLYSTKGMGTISEYNRYVNTRSVAFNPIYKRVIYEYTHPDVGIVTIAKGLPSKVLDTSDGGEDDANDQWKCQDYLQLRNELRKVDYDLSKARFKTIGVAVKINNGPFLFCGILPLLDPPRRDTAQTIANLVDAGVEVKMVTGDHLNIAKNIARMIGCGDDIHAASELREENFHIDPEVRLELIRKSNGIAQSLPSDKRMLGLTLRNNFQEVVGVTGDGVGISFDFDY